MRFDLSKPIRYLITRGASTETTTPESPEFRHILEQVSAAVAAGLELIQLREKRLTARILFELSEQSAALTLGSETRLLVNDRADVAAAAGADGVHLTTQSIDTATIRCTFGEDFLIGVSTHSLAEARVAKEVGADFVVFGPMFATPSKETYGPPAGLAKLAGVAKELAPFPVLALGGVDVTNARECLRAGASGIAGISLFEDFERLDEIVQTCVSETE
ncbi:MAG TPA: thiamine phosphate synthase [Pyrinomonadaceae bacterium]|nr:thiamine phosphate synthase [Pyrinomonadaceae bacterium]